jgi:hypothetical protein
MAKLKRTSKSAVKTAATKKPATQAANAAKKLAVGKPAKASTKAAAKAAAKPGPRRKQRVAISHYQEEAFLGDGLRAYAKYRDLGVAAATGGLAHAHVIRLIGPCDPKEVSKLHYHDAEFQLVYVLNGWIRDYSDNCELLEVILPAEFKTVEVNG